MKKFFAFILLLITLAAAFTPCCASDQCNEVTVEMTAHADDESTDDNCSPFVTCGYCNGFTQFNTLSEITFIPALITIYHERNTNRYSCSYTARLLEPPKTV